MLFEYSNTDNKTMIDVIVDNLIELFNNRSFDDLLIYQGTLNKILSMYENRKVREHFKAYIRNR